MRDVRAVVARPAGVWSVLAVPRAARDRRRSQVSASRLVAQAATVVAVGAAAALPAGAARGADPLADTRPCVVNREALSLPGGTPRVEVEARWEVRGRGRLVDVLGNLVVTYPWCDHSRREAWIGVVYGSAGRAVTVVWRMPPRGHSTPSVDPNPCPECQVIAAGKAALPLESARADR